MFTPPPINALVSPLITESVFLLTMFALWSEKCTVVICFDGILDVFSRNPQKMLILSEIETFFVLTPQFQRR